MFTLADFWGLTLVNLPASAALAVVAFIGYVFGQRTRKVERVLPDVHQHEELDCAARIAWQLEAIAGTLRKNLAAHHSQIELFKRRLRDAEQEACDHSWRALCSEAEGMLIPTMRLAQELARAYDQIRQQSEQLESFSEGRIDPLTGVANGRALQQRLELMLQPGAGGNAKIAVAIVTLDRGADASFAGNAAETLPFRMRRLAGLLRRSARDTDFVARYGDDELIVVMPETSQAGARVFSDRLRKCVAGEMAATISCGIAASVAGDDPKSLLARVDSALYTAKAAGTNRLFVHTGAQIREHLSHPAVIARNALSPQARMTRADLPGRSVDGTTCPGASDRSSPADPAGELAGTARA